MGDTEANKVNLIKIWLRVKIEKIKNSKPFLFLLALIIGATGMYLYLEAPKLYKSIFLDSRVVILVPAGVNSGGEQINEPQNSIGEESGGTLASSPEALIRKTFGDQADNAIRVADCESQLDPTRIGDTHMAKYSYGLFQINRTWHDYSPETLLNAQRNVEIAKEIYDKGGWSRWTCGRNLGIS